MAPKKTEETEAETGGALAVIDAVELPTLYVDSAKMDEILDKIRAAIAAEAPDPSTKAGRDRIRSLAYSVARTKTALAEAAENLIETEKAKIEAVRAEKKRVLAELVKIQTNTRDPLDKWEAADEKRREALDDRLLAIRAPLDALAPLPASADVAAAIETVNAIAVGEDDGWEEFRAKAQIARADTLRILSISIEAAQDRERAAARAAEEKRIADEKAAADAAELAKLRAEIAARDEREAAEKAERDAEAKRLADEAAEEARIVKEKADEEAASKKAAADRAALMDARLDRLRDIAARAMGQPLTAIAVARSSLPAEDFPWGEDYAARGAEARQAAIDALDAAEEAEASRIEAAAEEERKRIEQKAREDEQARALDEKAKADAEAEKLARNKRHRAKIGAEMMAAIAAHAEGLDLPADAVQTFAQRVTSAIMTDTLPHAKAIF